MTELYLSAKKYMINSNANFIVWKHHWLLPVLQCLGESASTGGKCGGSHLPASAVPNPKDHIDPYSNAMHVLSFKIIHFLAAFNSSLLKRKKIFPFFVFLSFLLKRKLTTWAQQHLTLEMKLNCHFFFFFISLIFGGWSSQLCWQNQSASSGDLNFEMPTLCFSKIWASSSVQCSKLEGHWVKYE